MSAYLLHRPGYHSEPIQDAEKQIMSYFFCLYAVDLENNKLTAADMKSAGFEWLTPEKRCEDGD